MSTAELFVCLDCEELPASMVRPALQGLADGVVGLLGDLPHTAVRTWATPRRLAVAIEGVPAERPRVAIEVTGPPAARAFVDGEPTKTAIGFARSKGVDVSALRIVTLPKRGEVVAATVEEGGERVVDLVRDGLAEVITRIPFRKSMIWGEGGLSFGRPLHRVIALYAGERIEGEAHGIAFSNQAIGHRLSPEPVTVRSAAEWYQALLDHHVEADLEVRTQKIRGLIDEAADGMDADAVVDEALLEEVTHLVEWPTLIVGTFDAELLELPSRLLVTSMKVHQRYFPVFKDGELHNRFLVIGNNPFGDAALIAEGNARVIRARFHDARFFLKEDRTKPLATHAEKLPGMQWIRGLGTMADKSMRVSELAEGLAPRLGADPAAVRIAGRLCKADLATQMVGEFPELQGHMGRLYAEGEALGAAAALAIEEHYLPAGADDGLPTSPEGAAVALADRLDTLVGCFGVGIEPKGGGDPQGLRRAALGVVRIVLDRELRGTLEGLLGTVIADVHAHAAAHDERFGKWLEARGTGTHPTEAESLADRLATFILTRWKANRVAGGVSTDVVDAVLAASGASDLVVLDRKLDALAAMAGTEAFARVLTVFKRVLNILGDARPPAPAAEALSDPAETALLAATTRVAGQVDAAAESLDYTAALAAIATLAEPVEAFFDAVMVMADDPAVRDARVGLLAELARVLGRVADFSRISTR